MELYKEILIKVLQNKRIEAIIEDDSLEDADCFAKIEEIVCLFDSLGSDGGSRHDFG